MAVTGAWDARMGDRIRESVGHRLIVQTRDTTGTFVTLDVLDCRLNYDEQRAPHIQGSVTCVLPTDEEYLRKLDPRVHGARVVISAGYTFPGEDDDVHQMADMVIRSRLVSRPDNTMTLDLASEECLIIDASPGMRGVAAASTGGPIQVMKDLISDTINNPQFITQPGAEGYQSGYGLEGEDTWDMIVAAGNTIGVQVYNDGTLGRYIFTPPAGIVLPVHHDLRVGAAGTLITSDVALTRDGDWANQAYIYFGTPDTTDQYTVGIATISDGPFAAYKGNTKIYTEDNDDTIVSMAEANQIAKSILLRRVTYGRSMGLSAVAAYWLRPRMSVTIQLPTGITEYHLVSAVEFDFGAGTMALKTRLPEGTPNVTLGV